MYIYIYGLTLKECREAHLMDMYVHNGLSPKWCRDAHQDKALSLCPLMVNGYQRVKVVFISKQLPLTTKDKPCK